jgi:Cu/Ag efflux protein CusF
MKHPRLAIVVILLALAVIGQAEPTCTCCVAPPAADKVGHPLRGVVVAILPEKSALLVKHEEVPGVMAAMTMLLKVDAPTLAAAKKGQSITATLIKKTDGWWIETVTPLATP